MITPQTYNPSQFPATAIESTDTEWPSLADAIDQLQSLELTAQYINRRDPNNYHLLRSVEELKQKLTESIAQLHPDWLDAIDYPQTQPTAQA